MGSLEEGDWALAGQTAALAAARLPLAPGLRALAEEWEGRPLKKALLAAAARLEAGEGLSEALDPKGAGLPAPLREVLMAGAVGDRLPEVLAQQLASHDVGLGLRRKLVLAMLYPAVLLSGLLGLFVFANAQIVSKLKAIYEDFGMQISEATAFLIWLSDSIGAIGWRLLPGLLALGGVLLVGWRYGLDATARQRMLARIPLLGPMVAWTGQARFARALALMTEVGVPTVKALRLSGEMAQDADVRSTCEALARDVERGRPLGEAMLARPWLDPVLAQVVIWGERSQGTPQGLRLAAETFESLARSQSEYVLVTVNVMAFVTTLLGLTLFLIGTFLPIFDLLGSLSGTGTWGGPPMGVLEWLNGLVQGLFL